MSMYLCFAQSQNRKNSGIAPAVTAQLIRAFVFAYAVYIKPLLNGITVEVKMTLMFE